MKKVLVTGATGAIGEACVRYFVNQGYYVVIHYHSNEAKAKALLSEFGEAKCEIVSFDVASLESVTSAIADLEVDVLVNNAGITKDQLFFWMKPEEWDSVIRTNLDGIFNVSHTIVSKMIKKKSGTVINIASISGMIGNIGQVNYSASKGGIIAFTKSLALEVARYNIRVNCVAPGLITSEMTEQMNEKKFKDLIPLRRFGNPDEVAETVFFLADKARYITAEIINVSGGMVR